MDVERYKKCDRIIDPLREAMFQINRAGLVKEDRDYAVGLLNNARVWLRFMEDRGECEDLIIRVGGWIDELAEAVEDPLEWNDKYNEIFPALIDLVFRSFLECYEGRRWGDVPP